MDNKINSKDIYDSLWRCRDFEISHLWQRSVFLTAFLVLLITAYGTLLLKVIDSVDFNRNMYIASIFILFLISVFSMLWIMMGKELKAWYECYESAIYKIERDRKYVDKNVLEMDEDEVFHGSLPKKIDKNLFSSKGGGYSPSRINIIGQVFLLLSWLALVLQSFCVWNESNCCVILASILVYIIAIIITYAFLQNKAGSSTLI